MKLFSKYKRILISDTAGMGKSTLMKRLTLTLIEEPFTIPILIELRKLNKKNSLIKEIYQQIDPIDKTFDQDLILHFLELGFFTIILDGYDEIPKDIEETITSQLKNFISKVPKNNFILTSRFESSLASFGDFQMFYINPLSTEESYKLIRNYDRLNNIKYAAELLAKLKERLDQTKEFLANPLLVSLLYKTYTFNRDIPSKKSTFYDEIYTALFKHHDSSKDGFKRPKQSDLDILDFRIILRHLAFETSKLGLVIYTEQELLKFISEAKEKSLTINFKESFYVEDLLTTVPLFIREGSKIKWAHKSLQDYFTAEYITFSQKKIEILKKIFESQKDKYLNILDIIYEIDPKLFRKVILLPVLLNFIEHFDTSYTNFPTISNELLNDRRAMTFGMVFCIINSGSSANHTFEEANKLFDYELKNEVPSNSGGSLYAQGFFVLARSFFSRRLIIIVGSKGTNIFIKRHRARLIDYSNVTKLPLNKPFIVNQDPASPINSQEMFEETNHLIFDEMLPRYNRRESYLINHEKAKSTVIEIQKEIQIEDADNDLKGI